MSSRSLIRILPNPLHLFDQGLGFAWQRVRKAWVVLMVMAHLITCCACAHVMVQNSLIRTQFYAGTCITSDTQCSMTADGQVDLSDVQHQLNLNLGVHLLAPVRWLVADFTVALNSVLPHYRTLLWMSVPLVDIFHPPKL
jgi:hypothetical protein